DDDAVLEKEEAGERPTHPARGIDRRRHGHEDGRDEHAGERQPPAPAHERLPVSAPARIVLAVAAGASGAIATPPGDVRWLPWLAPALLVLALPEASSRLRIALGVAYAVTLGVGNVGPWMAPAVAKYFGLARGPALGATLLGLGAIGIVHGVLLGVLLVLAAP